MVIFGSLNPPIPDAGKLGILIEPEDAPIFGIVGRAPPAFGAGNFNPVPPLAAPEALGRVGIFIPDPTLESEFVTGAFGIVKPEGFGIDGIWNPPVDGFCKFVNELEFPVEVSSDSDTAILKYLFFFVFLVTFDAHTVGTEASLSICWYEDGE